MPLRLYNTFTKREEEFTPREVGVVRMYTCGPTVYGRPHIGNYASFLMADLLRRWLEAGHGYTVLHVKNITDVGHLLHDADAGDDKVEREARRIAVQERGENAEVMMSDVIGVARKYETEFLEDEQSLNMLEPMARPRASETIPEMLVLIKKLMEKGHAYGTNDGIYFSVESFPQYGALSGNTVEQLSAGARVEVKEGKKHPADFALWKFCTGDNAHHVLRWSFITGKPVEGVEENPDAGFPGWHIECSAMSRKLLGDQLDIHTGGEDNIFPHHECEIAQSECALGVHPFARLWLHRRRIQLGDEKMSKSLGNVLSLPDVVSKGFSAMDLRYDLLSVHYRTNLRFSEEGLVAAQKERGRICEWFSDVRRRATAAQFDEQTVVGNPVSCEALEAFIAAMDADLNVSQARAVIFEGMTNYYAHLEKGGALTTEQFAQLLTFVHLVSKTFGCFDAQDTAVPSDVQSLLILRSAAREKKDFAESDRLRDEIAAHGYDVKDTSEGQVLRKR